MEAGLNSEKGAANLEAVAAGLRAAYPAAQENQTFITDSIPRMSISSAPSDESAITAPAFMIMAMGGVVLLIACLNLANMFLARGASRRTELAIRLSLGGGRVRLLRQLLCEGLVLSLLGGVLGVLLAFWGYQVVCFHRSAGNCLSASKWCWIQALIGG